jgi:8-oxo-dGTP pyrophosphatase MutT (NUDIX family)
MSNEFAALLAFAPDKTADAQPATSLDLLLRAKALSDRGDMAGKNRILADMVTADPTQFTVDSPAEKYPGLTHAATGFQIHAHPGVAAQVAPPDTTLIDMLALDRTIGADQEDRYKLAAAPAAKPLPYRDRAEMYATDKDGNVFGGLYEHGGFGVFGGGIDPGEDAAAAAAREFAEESGWSVANPRVLPFKPHTIDWKPPYSSPKQAERAKQFRGSRTYYVAGDLGEKIPGAKVDDLGRKDVRPYAIDEALRLAALDAVTDPVLVQANKNRKAVLEHLKALRVPAVKAAGFEDAPVTVCVDFDGTLAKVQKPFDPATVGKPRRRVVRLVRLLKEKGCRVIVWTVRGDTKVVGRWLRRNRVPYDYINTNPDQPPGSSGKLYADVYLDDKAVNAEDADAAVTAVLERVAPLLAERSNAGD